MSDTNYKYRTNYFSVNDIEAFRNFLSTVSCNDEVEISTDESTGKVSFNVDGAIYEIENDESEEMEYDAGYDKFLSGIQSFIAEGDACILISLCWEKMKYLDGLEQS